VSWRDRAVCRGTVKTDVFFDPDSTRLALAICQRCDVLLFCREDADRTETLATTDGIRGGETAEVRIRRRTREASEKCPECPRTFGSRTAVIRHRAAAHGYSSKHGTSSKYAAGCRCDECREARRMWSVNRRAS
jgi:uncharacterized C2H2 Zn-finger protein